MGYRKKFSLDTEYIILYILAYKIIAFGGIMYSVDMKNIKPLTDFRKHMKEYIEELQSSKKPIVLTQHGKSAAVMLDPELFQDIQDQIEFMKKVALGLDDIKNNRVHSFSDVKNDIYAIISKSEQK